MLTWPALGAKIQDSAIDARQLISRMDFAATSESLMSLPVASNSSRYGMGRMTFVSSSSGGSDKQTLPPYSTSDRNQRPLDEVEEPGVCVSHPSSG